MERVASVGSAESRPDAAAVLELLKPITWFPPMWAFGCGVASMPAPNGINWTLLISGILLTGPLVCGTSQAVNDWFDRHVDAINEPNRPIPSGRVPGQWGLFIAIVWSLVSLVVATALGTFGFLATCVGLALAWAYSAPPIRLKLNGWWGNLAVGVCYEGLPWVTGAAVMAATAMPGAEILIVAFLYSIGAHGIMTLNDFKSIEGDRRMGIASLPAQLGAPLAASVACVMMVVPQILVVVLLLSWNRPWHAAAVAAVTVAQVILMKRLLQRPRELAPWYNATGISLYVSGMLISAFALRALAASS